MRPALLHPKLSSSIQLNLVKVSKEQNQKPEEGVLPFWSFSCLPATELGQ